MTIALVINAAAVIALTLLLTGHETHPREAIAAMAAKRGEYALGVRAAVWCERRDRATMRLPYRQPVARRSTAARAERKRTLDYPPLKRKLCALHARTSIRGGEFSERADAAEAAGLRE